MGYYDQQYEPQTRSNKGSRRGYGLAAFGGAVLGGLLVLFMAPIVFQTGWGPSTGTEPSMISPSEQQPAGLEQTVNLSVNSDITEAVEKVSSAVVGVINLRQSSFWADSGADEGTGSGVIYKNSGDRAFVVTNHHVIEGANEIEVSLSDGTRVEAKLLGTDVITDLAVLEIDGAEVSNVAEFGNSESLRVGEPAIAIGNPLGLRFSSTVTQGIISAKDRSIPVDLTGNRQVDWHAEVLQTDAAINPGNSGGALINIHGQVIGINSMKIAQSSVEGIGFAIPTAIAVPVIEDLERFGEVQRPQMGVGIRSLSEIPGYHWQETLNLPSEVKAGVFVTSISPMSPAEKAGLKEYDVIVEIDGTSIDDGHELRKYLYTKTKIGDTVEVVFYREGKRETTTLQLTEQQSF
ncbi:S1C family serine protease [Bacillus sp. FJAT-45350]|uniref:S1C family serine protease n=1 Tax=Bacillus sp. FJAT-45350 TaxID=2011014 RepID=UPI000BB69933|nr:S1C family serine protease [Bacillus sp. FJAT-45350]